MRQELIVDPGPDPSEHVLRWRDGDGQEHEERVATEAEAMARWNALHEATEGTGERVHAMTWHELIENVNPEGSVVMVSERARAVFSIGATRA